MLALKNESNAKELRSGQSCFTAGSFPFHCTSLLSLLLLDTARQPPSLVPASQLKILTMIGSHS